MKTVQFIFALHNHQPVGNFDHVFDHAYNYSYLPFLELLEAYPGFRASLHHTGPLLEWLAKSRPEYLERLGELVSRGQVELLGGGFYEPILPVIPERDRVAQIERMSDWLEERFGLRPRGMWLAERVWEPNLPVAMHDAGIEFTVLDDSHFKSVGISDEEALGYYLTEDQGHPVAVFPIKETVRQRIPYGTPEEIVEYLRAVASEDVARTIVMADDGEKFGVWPGSYKHCYEDGWLYRFVELIVNNADWINLCHFGEVLDTTAPIGRVYLPTASYVEMMEWAMPPNAIGQYQRFQQRLRDSGDFTANKTFVRGGFWRSFFSKYAEANHIHKKMLRVSRKLEALSTAAKETEEFAEARNHLLQGQCNCGYWHGVFGGIYLTNLRTALYEHLIEAEKRADELANKSKAWSTVSVEDFDADGEMELLIDNPVQSAIFQPASGGTMIEHDLRDWNFNLLDTMMRRAEFYHEEIATRERSHGGNGRLAEDNYRRGSLVDHFFNDEATPTSFARAAYAELGDFVGQPYETTWKKERGRVVVTMTREAAVHLPLGTIPIRIEKRVILPNGKLENRIEYRVENLSDVEVRTRFGVEFVGNLLAGDASDRYMEIKGVNLGAEKRLDYIAAHENVDNFALVDEWLRLRVQYELSREATLWRLPIETVSNSEHGIETIYQGTVTLPVWQVRIAPGSAFEVFISQTVRKT